MALSISMTDTLGKLLRPGMRVASLGYPDLIAPQYMIEKIAGEKAAQLQYRKDSSTICKRHGLTQRRIADAASLFSLLGCTLTVYDVVRERGCEVLCDLNYPFQPHLKAWGFDIVLDVGTLEHCFNIGQAALNMANMVGHGGHILHENPFNWGNHGFYGLNPTWYHDFYTSNGFSLVECRLADREKGADIPHTDRFRFVDREVNIFAVAKRDEIRTLAYPTQTKYVKRAFPVAGVPGEQKEAA